MLKHLGKSAAWRGWHSTQQRGLWAGAEVLTVRGRARELEGCVHHDIAQETVLFHQPHFGHFKIYTCLSYLILIAI